MVALFSFVLDYYAEAVCVARLEAFRAYRYGAMAVFVAGLFLSSVWTHPFVENITALSNLKVVTAEDHVLSGGVIFSLVLMLFGKSKLTMRIFPELLCQIS